MLVTLPVECAQLHKEREVQLSKLCAPLLYPGLVAVLWQELASVEVYCSPKGLGLLGVVGGGRCLLEGFDIDPQRRIRTQAELLVPKEQIARRSGSGRAAASWGRGF